ncbi:cytosolic phospholipase A2-like [Acropora palmata]|uniref:cytosolic phospholipase A2-like n=1 Tax=Acropora palmata TaxID=6131 RepID=UPI003DA0349A
MEQHQDLYKTFVDLTKACDTLSTEGLWKITSKFGCPDRFVKIVKQFYDGMMARVLDDGNASDPFPVTNGVKQGCVLATTLFRPIFSAMLTDAFRETSPGIPISAEPSEMRYSTELCEKEKTFIEKRKKSVFNAMREFLGEHRGPQTVEEVPNVAILGSGGGFRAMVSLSGVFCVLKDMGVMDCAMYAAGLSGSAWYLSTLYSHPDWPNIHPRRVREQLRENVNDNWLWMMLKPSWTYRRLRIIMDKKRRGQPVSFTDFFGYLVGETIMKDCRKQPMLSEQQPKVQNAEVPFPLHSSVHVKNDLSAQEYSELAFHFFAILLSRDWVEFSPYEIGMEKYGTFMQTEHFGSKFFCGKLVKSYEEPPLWYLQGIWGSAFAILPYRVLQGEKLPDDTIEDMRKNGDLRDEHEKMISEKEEEDGHSEDDEEHRYEETQPNSNNTSDDEKKEDKEGNTFFGRVFERLVDNTKFLKTRGCRSAKIHNFLRGLSVQDFTEIAFVAKYH